jgi:hypothetical protein
VATVLKDILFTKGESSKPAKEAEDEVS